MKEYVVRLSSLRIENIKNVKNGIIFMPLTKERKMKLNGAEILGIYGQNGSGKTAIVDTLFFLQRIMIGKELNRNLIDYLDIDSSDAKIDAEFKIYEKDIKEILFEVGYHIDLVKENGKVKIGREYLNCAVNRDGKRTNKNIFMDYQRSEQECIFKPQKRLDELVGKNQDTKMDLIVSRKLAEKSNCSYIFGESSREIFCREHSDAFEKYGIVIQELYKFALKDLFVIRNAHSGMITANFILPMAFRVDRDSMGMKGDFAVPLMNPVVLDAKKKELLLAITEQINTVLCTIIPGMKIEVKDYGQQSLDSGEDGWKIELMSSREGKRPIPIRMESEGIIKIISILNALIQAFTNPSICLVIDELDAGIFEYMLGELLDIFQKSAKGQLIFTAHNLRALEMLDKESVMFSTTNPNNRYIHMKNVKDTNNIRSMYIRSITLGGQDEKIYDETDSLKIARAFRKAGRSLHNE